MSDSRFVFFFFQAEDGIRDCRSRFSCCRSWQFASPLALRRDFVCGVREIFAANHRYILPLWSAVYLIFLIAERSFNYVEVDARIISPAAPTLLTLWSALAVRASRLSIFVAKSVALIVLLIATWRQAQAASQTPRLAFGRTI